jgi:hypothetical protein
MDPDHFSYLIDRQHRFLLIGIVLLVMTVVFTLSGEILERNHGFVSRAEEPKRFGGMLSCIFSAVFSSLASTCTRIQTETRSDRSIGVTPRFHSSTEVKRVIDWFRQSC